jgi:hypothetical protein
VPNYYETLKEFHAELVRLLAEKDRINKRIESLTKAMESIRALAEELDEPLISPPAMPPDMEEGFTDRVRSVLKANSLRGVTAVDVRDALLQQTPNEDPKIMLIHTHNTLKRLHKQGEVDELPASEGRTPYRWKTANVFADYTRLHALAGLMNAPLDPDALLDVIGGSGKRLVDQVKEEFKPTYNPPDPLNKRGKK